MIRLDKTTRKLQIVLGGAVATTDAECTVSYYDVPSQTKLNDFSEYRGALQVSVSDDTTDVDICAAPTVAGTVRNIDYINIYNKDSASIQVTVKIDDGGTETILIRRTLTTLQTLFYEDGAGWIVIATS